MSSDLVLVLREYSSECRPQSEVLRVRSGGFSGALLWKFSAPRGDLVLRRWPPGHPDAERLRFLHDVLQYLAGQGIHFTPLPLHTATSATFVEHDGYLWELARWLPGTADFITHPSPQRLQAALRALAQLHRALEKHPSANAVPQASIGIFERREQLQALLGGVWTDLKRAVRADVWPEMHSLAEQIVALFPLAAPAAAQALEEAQALRIPVQPCLRDVWHEHILFVGDEVSGIIDFGALRVDSVAADVARLLGSMAHNNRALSSAGLNVYEAIRPLSIQEKCLVRAFDLSGILLSGIHWLKWIYVDRIDFPNRPAVLVRVAEVVSRLREMAVTLEESAAAEQGSPLQLLRESEPDRTSE